MLSDGVHSYAYDAENRIISVDGGATTYVYDANGQRVRKTVGGASTDYVYDQAGHAIAEVNASGWQRGEVYAGGRHIATYVNNATYFDHGDWLGTERVRTAVNGTSCETITSLPFGDAESTSGSGGGSSQNPFAPPQATAPPKTATQTSPEQQQLQKCHRATYVASGLGATAAMNGLGALLTGGVTPVSWYFEVIGGVETVGAGAVGIYAAYVCFQQ